VKAFNQAGGLSFDEKSRFVRLEKNRSTFFATNKKRRKNPGE